MARCEWTEEHEDMAPGPYVTWQCPKSARWLVTWQPVFMRRTRGKSKVCDEHAADTKHEGAVGLIKVLKVIPLGKVAA